VGNAVTWLANGKTPVIATHTSDLVIFENFFILYLQFHNPFSLITRPINSAMGKAMEPDIKKDIT
jgi:hypothetical protein